MKITKKFISSLTKDKQEIIKKAKNIYDDWVEKNRKKMLNYLDNEKIKAVFERLKDK